LPDPGIVLICAAIWSFALYLYLCVLATLQRVLPEPKTKWEFWEDRRRELQEDPFPDREGPIYQRYDDEADDWIDIGEDELF